MPDYAEEPDRLMQADDAALERHVRFIESLAEEMQRTVQEIVPLYEEVLESFADARVSDYVPIFVCRRVKRILSRSGISS
ncbi:MAG TPA: DUF3562 domain-containing protein [Noviherbaspirillum sp.]|nr:DUF3562 domain-containing protein [Noviherbaspirillum sp.]